MTAARTDIRARLAIMVSALMACLVKKVRLRMKSCCISPPLTALFRPEAQAAMHEGLDDHPKVTLHDYEGWIMVLRPNLAIAVMKKPQHWPTAAPKPFSRSIFHERCGKSESLA